MSGFIMNKIYNFLTTSLAVILLSALAGCNPPSNSTGASGQEPPLAGAKIGGEFTLTNQDGEKASDTDFSGQYRIVYFGYSYCPDVCPIDLAKLMLGLKQAEKDDADRAAKIQPLFITIDPERDTPEVLKQYEIGRAHV